MPRARKSLLTLLALALALSGCGKGKDEARLELAQMNIQFSNAAFIDSARQGNAAAVALFVKAGMDTEVRNSKGLTPLHAATLANQFDVVKLLIEKRADVNATNRYKGTPLMTAAWAKNEPIFNLL